LHQNDPKTHHTFALFLDKSRLFFPQDHLFLQVIILQHELEINTA